MSAPAGWSVSQTDDNNPARKLAVLMLMGFIFLSISRILEAMPALASMHIPLIMALLTTAAAGISGCLGGVFKTRAARICGLMTAWMALGVPFSMYRRGSFMAVIGWLQHPLIIFLLVLGAIVTFREAAYLMNTIALASLAAALVGLKTGSEQMTRLTIEGNTIGNPNDLAFVVLLGVPFWLRFMRSGGPVRGVLGLAALLPILACFFRTGSRGGLVAFGAMAVAVFLRVSLSGKTVIALTGALVLAIGLVILPPALRQRYFTFSDTEARGNAVLDDAMGSTGQRKAVLVESLRIAVTHPLFGVGVDQFATAENRLAVEQGRRKGMWIGTHNTYTQFAAECGIPMAIFFMCLLATASRSAASARRRLLNDPRPLAHKLNHASLASEAALWGMATFIFFAHRAYDPLIYLLIAVAVVVARSAERELPALSPVAYAPAATPPNFMAPVRLFPAKGSVPSAQPLP